MKFDMNIFLAVAALALVQVSAEDSEETRELQYDPAYTNSHPSYYNGSPYGASGYAPKGKKGKKAKGKKPGKRPADKKDDFKCKTPESSACAPKLCQAKFDKANGYGGYGYGFSRENCKWNPKAAGMDKDCFGGKMFSVDLTPDEQAACECFWTFEAQCQSNVWNPQPKSCNYAAPGEKEIDLAMDIRAAIIEDDLCKYNVPYYRNLEGKEEGDRDLMDYPTGGYNDYTTGGYDEYSAGGYGYKPAYCPVDCFSEEIIDCFCQPQG
jgi:hypothetical protein